MRVTLLLFSLLLSLPAASAAGDAFDAHWRDGRAELDGYRLTVSRYGAPREGTAVMIYVTEPFSEKRRVKVDDPSADPDDTFEALKLNLVRDFQTGIYDYNTMVSHFARSDDFAPVKTSFSSQEWCGHVYEERVFDGGRVARTVRSYFDGESGEEKLDLPSGAVTEDGLFIVLRGLRGPFLKPGEKESFAFLPGTFVTRLSHASLVWTTATIERSEDTEEIEVPAGRFETVVYRIDISGGREGVFHVEEEYPHRIVRWELDPDLAGELTGSKRLAYWKLHDPGGESHLAELGLPPPDHR